jgi:hypothetical protein
MSQDSSPAKKRCTMLDYVLIGAALGLVVYAIVDMISCRTRKLLALPKTLAAAARAHFGASGTSEPPRMP